MAEAERGEGRESTGRVSIGALTLAFAMTVGCSSGHLGSGPHDGDAGNSWRGGTTGTAGTRWTGVSSGTSGTGGVAGHGFAIDAGPEAAAAVAANQELRAKVAQAGVTWAAAKPSCATYTYQRMWSGVFSGVETNTVEVHDGVTTRLHWRTAPFLDADAGILEGEDTPEELAKRGDLTVEGLLAECARVLDHDPPTTTFELSISSLGVPMTCNETPIFCVDDCTVGINLRAFVCAGGAE